MICFYEIAPPYAGLELGVGDAIIMKAISESIVTLIFGLGDRLSHRNAFGKIN